MDIMIQVFHYLGIFASHNDPQDHSLNKFKSICFSVHVARGRGSIPSWQQRNSAQSASPGVSTVGEI